MQTVPYFEALKRSQLQKSRRNYPGRDNPRFVDDLILPEIRPKFKLPLNASATVFTIGSCFARNIEEALVSQGMSLPTSQFRVPKSEWHARPNGLLNEFNPGTIAQRIEHALGGRESHQDTLVGPEGETLDLLLLGGAPVDRARASERRREIFNIYASLAKSDILILTLGFIEAWYDTEIGCYLNRMPPMPVARAQPNRYEFRRLDYEAAYALLEPAIRALSERGVKTIITVSPVPIQVTFAEEDCVVANEYSKAVLRLCAEMLKNKFEAVDYFPSYEIVRTSGLASYIDDNVHVKDGVVRRVVEHMINAYGLREAEAVAAEALPGETAELEKVKA